MLFLGDVIFVIVMDQNIMGMNINGILVMFHCHCLKKFKMLLILVFETGHGFGRYPFILTKVFLPFVTSHRVYLGHFSSD